MAADKYQNNFSIKCLKLILLPFGIIPDKPIYKKYQSYYVFTYIIHYSFVLVSLIYTFIILPSFVHKSDTIVYILFNAACFIIICWVYKFRNKYEDFFVDVSKSLYSTSEFFSRFDRNLKVKIRKFGLNFVGSLMFTSLYPLATILFTEIHYDTPESYLFPFSFPWRVNSSYVYISSMIWQLFAIGIALMMFCGATFFTVYCSVFIDEHLNMLEAQIARVGDNKACAECAIKWKMYKNVDDLMDFRVNLDHEKETIARLNDIIEYCNFLNKYVGIHELC